jgi:hypothetical protein
MGTNQEALMCFLSGKLAEISVILTRHVGDFGGQTQLIKVVIGKTNHLQLHFSQVEAEELRLVLSDSNKVIVITQKTFVLFYAKFLSH